MNAFGLVFANRAYVALACIFFAGLLIPLLLLAEFVFLEPYVVAHLPPETEAGLALIVAVSGLSGLVIPMNIYRIRVLRGPRTRMGGGILGSIVGAAAGACSCGPVGFAVISTFGSIGGTATAFLATYEMPLRMVSVAILATVLYTTTRSLNLECRVDN